MISAATFHVISTELVIGMFALSGITFLMLLLGKYEERADVVAHWSMTGGIFFLPFAIVSGSLSDPSEGLTSPLLANKVILSFTALGLGIGVLVNRWRYQGVIDKSSHAASGMIACGLILVVASLGGMYSRGESLLFFIPKDFAFVIPVWASGLILVMGIVLVGRSTVEHR